MRIRAGDFVMVVTLFGGLKRDYIIEVTGSLSNNDVTIRALSGFQSTHPAQIFRTVREVLSVDTAG